MILLFPSFIIEIIFSNIFERINLYTNEKLNLWFRLFMIIKKEILFALSFDKLYTLRQIIHLPKPFNFSTKYFQRILN